MEEEFTRAFKRARGEIRQQARDLRSSLLSGANQGTKRRREIKAFAEEAERRAIIDLTTEYRANPNKDDYESDISQRGIDQFIHQNRQNAMMLVVVYRASTNKRLPFA